jgi:3,4-dihydroxy 2-butanone 4-phosphate synthase/GTP cyclohydrolase II
MVAAEKVTPEIINFMATYGRGLICLAMTGQRLDELNIPLMVSEHTNTSPTALHFASRLRRGAASPRAFRVTTAPRRY